MLRPYNPDKYPHQTGWRAYQEYLQRNNRPRRRQLRLKRSHWIAVGLLVLVSAVIGINLKIRQKSNLT